MPERIERRQHPYECPYREEMVVQGQDIKHLVKITESLNEALQGNGKDGLITRVAVVKSSVMRLWGLGLVLFTTIIGLVVKAII